MVPSIPTLLAALYVWTSPTMPRGGRLKARAPAKSPAWLTRSTRASGHPPVSRNLALVPWPGAVNGERHGTMGVRVHPHRRRRAIATHGVLCVVRVGNVLPLRTNTDIDLYGRASDRIRASASLGMRDRKEARRSYASYGGPTHTLPAWTNRCRKSVKPIDPFGGPRFHKFGPITEPRSNSV